jgi:hypothetical protein
MVAAPLLVACGGTFATSSDSGGSSGAGAGAAGGGAAGAGAASGAAGASCTYQGKTYPDGARFPASDGCNGCSCQAGSVSCTLLGCPTGCQYQGQSYQTGQSFKVDCNTCTCEADGSVSCTEAGCLDQCAALKDQYAGALKKAKACDPKKSALQCTETVSGSLGCGCATPVNPVNASALKDLASVAAQSTPECDMLCTPCVAPGVASCTEAGSCEYTLPPLPAKAACKVDGVIYQDGASGIRRPWDCNTCTCEDGQLSLCTLVECPSGNYDCPSGTSPGNQCAQCGPTDACQIVEYACLPNCTDACATGVCSNGVCRQICG